MDTKKLRQKILDLAIRGKLVPQDPNDEPASVLLERIRAEKERLIAEGKIKRPKKSKASSSESHYQNFTPPFEIPDNWEWVRLEELVEFQGGYAYKSNTYINSSNWQVVRIGNVKNDKLLLDSQPVFVPEQIGNDTIKYQIQSDDILFTMTGTKGKRDYFYSVKVPPTSTKLLLNQRVGCLRCIVKDLNIDYLCKVLKSTYILDTIFATETGNVSQGNIGSESTLSLYIPLPPYSEQERIVGTLNEFILTLNNIENYRGDLQETIQNAKSKILELAMQGKLVPQDPTDEPASDMLLRINPKAKIITDNPHSWKIPSGWCITDLKSIGKWQSGATPSRMNPNYYGKGIPWLNTGDLTDGEIYNIPKEITELALKETSVKLNPSGSILIAMYGATIGKLGILTFEATTNQACCACAKCFIFNKFLFHLLKHHRPTFIKIGGGGAQSNISKEKIENTVIYLPPLNEQKRIVAKIEELYSVLDETESSLQS